MKINLFCTADTKMQSVTNLKWFDTINLKQLKPKFFFTFYYHGINNTKPEEPKKKIQYTIVRIGLFCNWDCTDDGKLELNSSL